MGPAYILFGPAGRVAFGCITDAFAGCGDRDAVEFDWDGNDEMDEAQGGGWAELQTMARSPAKSASRAAPKSPSPSDAGRLLQHPAKCALAVRRRSNSRWDCGRREFSADGALHKRS
jgi:hypothetical protein